VVELANNLDRLLQLLIVAQPAAHLGHPFAAQAELARASTGVAHSENRERVTFAGEILRGSLLQRTIRNHATGCAKCASGHGEPIEQLLARCQSSMMSHSYK
jgi:hypothetical protein